MLNLGWSPEARIRRGAKLLDKKVPGWDAKINTTRLNLSSATDCVLGQLFSVRGVTYDFWSGYLRGLEELFGSSFAHGRSSWHGFVPGFGESWFYEEKWKDEIAQRRTTRLIEADKAQQVR